MIQRPMSPNVDAVADWGVLPGNLGVSCLASKTRKLFSCRIPHWGRHWTRSTTLPKRRYHMAYSHSQKAVSSHHLCGRLRPVIR